MPEIRCNRCGDSFDTDRDPPYPHADTTRCPQCGEKHDVDNTATVPAVIDEETSPETTAAQTLAAAVESADGDTDVHLHLHTHRE